MASAVAKDLPEISRKTSNDHFPHILLFEQSYHRIGVLGSREGGWRFGRVGSGGDVPFERRVGFYITMTGLQVSWPVHSR